MQHSFQPDFESECSVCSASPCVLVIGHKAPVTNLCGPHFFNDPQMVDWDLWSDYYYINDGIDEPH